MFTTIVNNNVVLAALPIGGSVAAPVSWMSDDLSCVAIEARYCEDCSWIPTKASINITKTVMVAINFKPVGLHYWILHFQPCFANVIASLPSKYWAEIVAS
jgi:hypothetical protein